MALIDNYLFLEQPLIDHVKTNVHGLKMVAGRNDLTSLDGDRQIVPAVYIIYLGDELAEGANHQGNRQLVQTVTQHWAAVLVVNPADSSKDGKNARTQAGALLAKLIKSLTGFKPFDYISPFCRSAGRTNATAIGSYFYYPLLLTTNFIFPEISQWKSTP